MLTPELEQLIQYALADGILTPKERAVLMKKAEAAGADLDEFEMILEAKVHEAKKAAAAAAPKPTGKHGNVRKCPHCGAPVSGFQSSCSECGHEFSNIEAVKSANVLFEKLQTLEMEKARELAAHEETKNKQLMALSERHNNAGAFGKLIGKDRQNEERDDLVRTLEKDTMVIEKKYRQAKLNMIKLYAVPNTKEDLLELLSMASAAAYDNDGVIGDEEEVWLQKTDQIYQKLLVCAANDTTTLNQATNMIVSLIKRLPKNYKQFTRIPKAQHDKIAAELKAQKQEQKAAIRQQTFEILKGWRGIMLVVSILVFIFSIFTGAEGVILFVSLPSLIVIIVAFKLIKRALKEVKEDILY